MSGLVICENWERCGQRNCSHKTAHERHWLCDKGMCSLSGLLVGCVPVSRLENKVQAEAIEDCCPDEESQTDFALRHGALFRAVINEWERDFNCVPTKDQLIWCCGVHLERNIRED